MRTKGRIDTKGGGGGGKKRKTKYEEMHIYVEKCNYLVFNSMKTI